MEPLKIYDYLTLVRGRVFGWTRPLSAEQYGREFPIGLGTLGRTLTHMMICEWAYVQRIQRLPVPPYDQWPIRDEQPPPFAALEAEWNEQAGRTRAALSGVRDWNEEFEYRVTREGMPVAAGAAPTRTLILTVSAADIFTQLALHEVHHRAQAMNMLRQSGVTLDEIDFNTLMYKRREVME